MPVLSVEGENEAARMVPETKYAKSGNVHIAYQVTGDGPVDLVFVHGWISHTSMGRLAFEPRSHFTTVADHAVVEPWYERIQTGRGRHVK
jgi:hypothetical protein